MIQLLEFAIEFTDSIHIYMDMMGKKYKISESRKSTLDSLPDISKAMKDIEITEFPKDTREILGYHCHRVDLKMKVNNEKSKNEETGELNITMYVTKDLKFDASFVTQTSKKLLLDGTPLEYSMTMGSGSFKIELTMLAKEYKKEVSPSDLLPPAGNYKVYSMEQFQKEMSGMGR